MSVFKIAQPPSVNANETKSPVAPVAGKGIVRSQRSGDPLPAGGADTTHDPTIPWPQPVPGVDHKPFKVKE